MGDKLFSSEENISYLRNPVNYYSAENNTCEERATKQNMDSRTYEPIFANVQFTYKYFINFYRHTKYRKDPEVARVVFSRADVSGEQALKILL